MKVSSRLRKMFCILILVVYICKHLLVYVLTIILNKEYNLKFQNKMKNEIKTGKFLMQSSSQDLLNPGLVFEKVITFSFPFFGIIYFVFYHNSVRNTFTNDRYFFSDNGLFGGLNVIGGQMEFG